MDSKITFDHFIGINALPKAVHFHPNGENYVFSAGGNVIIGNLNDPHSQRFFSRHDDTVTCLALSYSGRFVASGQKGENSNVYVWDVETGEVIYSLEEHDFGIQDMGFSHDEKLLVTLGCPEDGKLIVWDMSTGNIVASSSKVPPNTLCVKNGGFVKDIKRRETDNYLICTGGEDGVSVWVLDPYEGNLNSHRVTNEGRQIIVRSVTSIDFSYDRELIFAATSSGDYLLATTKSLRIVGCISATRMFISSIVSLPNNQVLLGCGDGTLKFFSTLDNSRLREVPIDGEVVCVSPSHDHLECLVCTSRGTVYRVNVITFQHIIISENHTQNVLGLAYSIIERDRVATCSADGTIRLWDLSDLSVIATAVARKEQERGVIPQCLALSDIILSGWSDGRVLAHSADDGRSLWFIDNAHQGGVTALALSHNRRFLLTGGSQGDIRLWELRTRELISHLKEHGQKITTLALFEDDSMAVSGSRDRCILRWDLRMEKRIFCHMQRMGGINGVVLSKDEQCIVSVGQEKKLTYWNKNALDFIHSENIDDERDEGRCISLSHNGKLLVTGGTAGILRLWDYESARCISEMIGHSSTINCVSFSPDDHQVMSVGEDGCIFIWNIYSGGA